MADTPAAKALRDAYEMYGVDSPEARAAFEVRAAEVQIAELIEPRDGLWWLSFCDPNIEPADPPVPGGPSFLGVCVVEGMGEMDAIQRSHALGINPGGEVSILGPMPLADFPSGWRSQWCDRLLSFAEVEVMPGPNGESPGAIGMDDL